MRRHRPPVDPGTLGAEPLGLKTGHLGLEVTPYLRTSVAHVYAAGDAAGNAQLTPVAAYEGRVAAHNALRGDRLIADTTLVPQSVFTTPEVAKVGLTHRAATEAGVNVPRRDTGSARGLERPRHR